MSKHWGLWLPSAVLALILPALSSAQLSVNISVNLPPPELPVYEQPPIPGDGYLWTPGYWAWSEDDQDYYWVPGTWVLAPQPNYLWTPGYWEMAGAVFLWHAGYWGPHVGFYGGVNYGHGYGGRGYEGGYWRDGRLFYNRAVTNISNARITNVYNRTVVNNITVNRVSYNGGNGVHARPTANDRAAEHDRHISVTSEQRQHIEAARSEPSQHLNRNQGRPPVIATPGPDAQKRGTSNGRRPAAPAAAGPSQAQPSRGAPLERNVQAPRPAPTPHNEVPPHNENLSHNEGQRRVQPESPREARPAREPRAAEPPPREAPQHRETAPQRPAAPRREAEPHPAGRPPENQESHEPH